MKTTFFAALATAALLTATPALATTQILTFSGSICGVNGNQACGNALQIGANYGDTPEIDLSYRALNGMNGAVVETVLRTWTTGYGDLSGVAYGGSGSGNASEIIFKPAAGYEVALIGFDFATYQRRAATVPFSITNFSGSTVINASTLSTHAPTHNSLAVNSAYFTDGIILKWGPNGYEVGLDNVQFDVRKAAIVAPPTSGAPEPGAWALMLLGFGGMGAMLRRRVVVA